jgi:parallel beta-helix repeat protein
MKILKNEILPILLISIFASAAVFTLNSTAVKAANVLQVPSANYPTLQSALNAANNGDTINIASGTYLENINYNGYSNNMVNGIPNFKAGITVQGSKDVTINGDVTILYLKQLKIDSLTITGSLTLGDCGAYGYVANSVISNVHVQATTTIGGPSNTLTSSTVNSLILKGGNTKMEFPAYKTITENNQITNGVVIKAGSHSNTIKGNVISNAAVGISEEPSKTYYTTGNNQITNNTLIGNNMGIRLYSSTGDNGAASHTTDEITQNIIKDNSVGIEFSASAQFPYGNTLYHNDFINNGAQVKINNPVPNIWDDGRSPRKGNYWSDYKGLDINGDGIGDTAYVVNAENQDNYPLMLPWSAPNPSPTPTVSPNPAPTSSQSSSQSQVSVVPELAPFMVIAALVAVSLLTLLFKNKHPSTF